MGLKETLAASVAMCALTAPGSTFAETYVSLFAGLGTLTEDAFDFSTGSFYYSAKSSVFSSSSSVLVNPVGDTRGYTTENGSRVAFVYATYVRDFFQNRIAYDAVTFGFSEGNFNSGFVLAAAVGYRFDIGLRPELEIARRYHKMGGVQVFNGGQNYHRYWSNQTTVRGSAAYFSTWIATTTTATTPQYTRTNHSTATVSKATLQGTALTSGDITSYAIMANLWYDFIVDEEIGMRPFIGGGVGMANVSFDYAGTLMVSAGSQTFSASNDTWSTAWQFGAGVAFDIVEGASLSAQYRYFATEEIDLGGGNSLQYESHAVMFGLTLEIGR